MKILVAGSIAFDTIMVFNGRFRDHILPDQIHMLNVSFLVPSLRREFGGVAGNIAYNLSLLGAPVIPVGTVGDDGEPYLKRFDALGIDRRCVQTVAGTHTAQAFITTDLDDNQISAFHPGALDHSVGNRIPDHTDAGIALVGPEGRAGMLAHAGRLAELGIPFFFDPGQAMPLLDDTDLAWLADRASYAAFNDYEANLFASKTGRSIDELAKSLTAVFVTKGAQGAVIKTADGEIAIPPTPADNVVDPTGCGDAFRGGLLYGLSQGMDLPTAGRLAATMGAIKIGSHGGQQHKASRAHIEERFMQAYGYRPF
jgi:adenosine kinase